LNKDRILVICDLKVIPLCGVWATRLIRHVASELALFEVWEKQVKKNWVYKMVKNIELNPEKIL